MWQKAEGRRLRQNDWRIRHAVWRKKAAGRWGQSTLEYVLIIAVVLAVVVAAATALIGPATRKTVDDSAKVIENASGKLKRGLGLD